MKKFNSSNKDWSEITDKVHSICEKNGIASDTNISDQCMWIRPNDVEKTYKEIEEALKSYKNLVQVEKPCKDPWETSRYVMEITRK